MKKHSEQSLYDKMGDMAMEANKSITENGEIIKESSKDWVGYVVSHPLQSILFGMTIGLALRGLMK